MECYLLSQPKIRVYTEAYTGLMAAKGYVSGIRTRISWSGKYYLYEELDDWVRDRRAGKEGNWEW